MPTHPFRILNVFAETTLGGNPLAVFEDACGIDEATLQANAPRMRAVEADRAGWGWRSPPSAGSACPGAWSNSCAAS